MSQVGNCCKKPATAHYVANIGYYFRAATFYYSGYKIQGTGSLPERGL